MIRNLKALGLALVAAFALSAITASMASAQQGTLTADGPVTPKTDQTGLAGTNAFTAFAGPNVIECSATVYTGHKVLTQAETAAGKKHELIPVPATTITLTPHYGGTCTAKIGATAFPATFDLEGCDFVAHIGQTTGGVNGTYGVTLDVVCPTAHQIELIIWTNAASHASFTTPMCVIDVKEQTGLAGAHITDNSPAADDDLSILGTVTNIHAQKTKTTHPLLCPDVTTGTASLHIDATVTGFNAAGGKTDISLSE